MSGRPPRRINLGSAKGSNSSHNMKKKEAAAAESEARLQQVLGQAEYELNVDPYRGMMHLENGVLPPDCPWRPCQFVPNMEGQDDEETAERKVFAVCHCACPSLISWTEKQDELQRRRKNKRKKTAADKKAVDLLLGRRPDDDSLSFGCDSNPFCLASLGGVMDELLAQAAEKVLLREAEEDENDSPQSQQVINVDDGETDSEQQGSKKSRPSSPVEVIEVVKKPAAKNNAWNLDLNDEENVFSKVTMEQIKEARRPCHVAPAAIQSYVESIILPYSKTPLTFDSYMDQLHTVNDSLAFTSPLMPANVGKQPAVATLPLPPGIRNLGATCYLNTQLQCLARNLAFLDGIFAWRPSEENGSQKQSSRTAMMNSVLSTLQLLLARLVHGGEATVNTQDFSKALGLENNEMQDPNEFARLLFERMHESFVNKAGLANLLPSLFQGTMAYETTCRTCGNVSEREEGFMDLNLPIEKVTDSATPTAKRTGQQSIKDMFGSKGSNVDTDVQFCLDQYLRSEELTGDNQYFCEGCQSKRDAERAVTLHKLPPILNVQISRYVFDRAKFVKKKLSDKVLLPRVLRVPEKGSHQRTNYLLCAVMKHQGTSAYQGHYVAEAMDWQSGTWFEFNDECVSVLENGPSCSYDPLQENGTLAQRKLPAGSKDAYNMYYVKESYLGETTARTVASSRSGPVANEEDELSVIGRVAKERQHRYRILNEMCYNDGQTADKLRRRRKCLLEKLGVVLADHSAGLSFLASGDSSYDTDVQPPVWVDGNTLRKFLACKPENESTVRYQHTHALRHKHLLCKHNTGLHPRVSRHGKLLPRPVYDVIAELLRDEIKSSNPDVKLSDHANDCIVSPIGNLYCGECVAEYRGDLKYQLKTVKRLKQLNEDLLLAKQTAQLVFSSDESGCDEEELLYCVSSKFIIHFRKFAGNTLKALEDSLVCPSTSKLPIQQGSASLCEGLDALDLSPFEVHVKRDTALASTMPYLSSVEPTVNVNITCEHNNLSVSSNGRNTCYVPESVWLTLKALFPRAIALQKRKDVLPPSAFRRDKCSEHCPLCRNEEDAKEESSIRLKQWAAHVQGTLLGETLRKPRSMDEVLSRLLEEDPPGVDTRKDIFLVHHADLELLRKAFKAARSKNDDGLETLDQIDNLLFKEQTSDGLDADPVIPGFEVASDVEQLVVERFFRRWQPRSLICTNHCLPCQAALFQVDSVPKADDSEWLGKLCAFIEPLTHAEFLSYVQGVYSLSLAIVMSGNERAGGVSSTFERRVCNERSAALSRTHHVIISSPLSATAFVKKLDPRKLVSLPEMCNDPQCNRRFEEEQEVSKNFNENVSATTVESSNLIDITDADESADGGAFSLRVYEIEKGKSVSEAVASVLQEPRLEKDTNGPMPSFLRRSSRKRKTRYPNGPIVREDVIDVKLQHNIAAVRLFLYEKCLDFHIGENLTLVIPAAVAKPQATDDALVDSDEDTDDRKDHTFIELPFEWNSKEIEGILKEAIGREDGDLPGAILSGVFLCRVPAIAEKKRARDDREQENAAVMDSVIELSNASESSGATAASPRGKRKTQRVERGFRGTFLHAGSASPAQRDAEEEKKDADDEDTEQHLGDTGAPSVSEEESRVESPEDNESTEPLKTDKREDLVCIDDDDVDSSEQPETIAQHRSTRRNGIMDALFMHLGQFGVKIHDATARKAMNWARDFSGASTEEELLNAAVSRYMEDCQ